MTSYQYLLDTNVLSDLVKHPQGLVFQRITKVGEDSICTSIIVACELRFGATKNGSSRLISQLEQILKVLQFSRWSHPWIGIMLRTAPI